MLCHISGEAPQDPVVSRKTGQLFERRLILKYLSDNGGKEPGTNEVISEEDLITVKLASKIVKPRPPTVNSVPILLSMLQNEWDSVMLETYQLKQQYHQLRQELSNALYENDAAKRVIARLAKERDQARENLAAVSAAVGGAAAAAAASAPASEPQESAAMDVDEPASLAGVTPEISQVMDNVSTDLSKVRRKRKSGPEMATVDEIKQIKSIKEVTNLHGVSNAGVLCLDLLREHQYALTGGKDGSVLVTSWKGDEDRQVASVKAHAAGKKVTSVAWLQSSSLLAASTGGAAAEKPVHASHAFVTASVDKTAKVYRLEHEQDGATATIGKADHIFKGHEAEVTGISVHASGKYFATASLDSTWAFNDVETGKQISRHHHSEVGKGYTSVAFHPDGLLLATGTADSVVRIWEAKSAKNVKSFEGAHVGKVTSIAFSENGYYLATGADGHGVVRLWDLRKLNNFHSIDLSAHGVTSVSRVAFDFSGQYLGVAAGKDIRVYLNKQWDELAHFTPHSADVTDFKFAENARHIVSCGMDRKVSIFGV